MIDRSEFRKRWPLEESRVFILGAGFSADAGFPLVRQLKSLALDFMSTTDHPFLAAVRRDQRQELQRALELTDPEGTANFEIVMGRMRESTPGVALDALEVATAQLLWTLQRDAILPSTYSTFSRWLRRTFGAPIPAVISFNWDLVAEKVPDDACIPFGYVPDMSRGTPVIKPHGSINWSAFRRRGSRSEYPSWMPFAEGLAADGADFFRDPDPPDTADARYMPFPGQKELPHGDDDQEWLWDAAAEVVGCRHTLVFIGYSMPEYDSHAIDFFRRNAKGKKIEVYNPSEDSLAHFRTIFAGEDIEPVCVPFAETPYATNDPDEIERELLKEHREGGEGAWGPQP